MARRPVRMLALLAMLAGAVLLAGGCGSSADSAGAADGPPREGGVVTIGMDQEPTCLNTMILCGGMAAASNVVGPLFDSFITIDAKGERQPQIASEVPSTDNGGVVVTSGGGMTVTMHIKPEAHWSDGKPITCEDAQFTLATRMSDEWMISSRKGWEDVSSIDCPDPHTMVWNWKTRYAPFLEIVGSSPLPKHELEGKDFNSYWNAAVTVSSGPFIFDHWNRSVDIVLKPDPNYWNAGPDGKPWLDGLRYVFIGDTNTMKIQLRTGEVDFINPPPDTTLKEELSGFPRADFGVVPGIYWEQLAFNTAKAPTDDLNVRLAIAHSIDRVQIADVVLKKQVGVLDSTLLPNQKDYYVPAWGDLRYDEKLAAKYLEASGWKRNGAYYEKGGKPLTVMFKSTAGNNLRLKVSQLLQQSLKKNGIRMEIQLEPADVFFGQSTIQGAFNLGLWAWSSGIDPSQYGTWACDMIPTKANEYEGQNYYKYCNKHVTELLKKADVEPNVPKRAAMLKEVQALMRKDLPVLPFYQRPETIAWSSNVKGMLNNPLGGPVWNSYDWSVNAK